MGRGAERKGEPSSKKMENDGLQGARMFTTTGTYAMRAMSCLARHPMGTRLSARSLGRELRIPVTYLGKVLQLLARNRLLKGYRGRYGGYSLINSPQNVSLYEVLCAVERIDRYGRCVVGHDACPGDESCLMYTLWGLTAGKSLTLLRRTTVAELVAHDDRVDRFHVDTGIQHRSWATRNMGSGLGSR